MKLNEIHIRDPYVLVDDNKYYLYGTRADEIGNECSGLDVYVSEDLENWSKPIEVFTKPADFWADRNFWAPEVHRYDGNYYMFVTFQSETRKRGVQILKANSSEGPFLVHSDGPVTPEEWSCLDGTLYIENDVPYMIFCHEWTQVGDGEMCAVELTADLKNSSGKPFCCLKHLNPIGHAVFTGKKSILPMVRLYIRCRTERLLCFGQPFRMIIIARELPIRIITVYSASGFMRTDCCLTKMGVMV